MPIWLSCFTLTTFQSRNKIYTANPPSKCCQSMHSYFKEILLLPFWPNYFCKLMKPCKRKIYSDLWWRKKMVLLARLLCHAGIKFSSLQNLTWLYFSFIIALTLVFCLHFQFVIQSYTTLSFYRCRPRLITLLFTLSLPPFFPSFPHNSPFSSIYKFLKQRYTPSMLHLSTVTSFFR